ncbi:hypothetical protein D082_06220 [Synechocystis sp. PCC 6714]|nr:hypothetical protein D082_06220 [Synechocystis sp. PCC 6714]
MAILQTMAVFSLLAYYNFWEMFLGLHISLKLIRNLFEG